MKSVFEHNDSGREKATTIFILLFTATLAASIFLNQIGYYGALCMLLWGWVQKKENPFSKTGLEIAFVLYLAAILVSALFSENRPEAMHNLLKRALLIPTVYTLAAAASSGFKFRLYYKSIVVCTAVIALIYTGFAVNSYLTHEIQRTGSGPAVFQHPITTSQMFTYALLLSAALFIADRSKSKQKWIFLGLSLILLVALLGTYKRTGWLGAAVGITFISVLARRWYFVGGILVFLVLVSLTQVNQSSVVELSKAEPGRVLKKIETDGRAGIPVQIDSVLVIPDFDKGILYFDTRLQLIRKQPVPEAITGIYRLNDTLFMGYFYNLSMQRYVFRNGSLHEFGEPFLAPGDTRHAMNYKENIYFLDIDSGLTVFTNTTGTMKVHRYPKIYDFSFFSVDAHHLLVYAAGERAKLFVLDSLGLPTGKTTPLPFKPAKLAIATIDNGILSKVHGNQIEVYSVADTNVSLVTTMEAKGIIGINNTKDSISFNTVHGILSYYPRNAKQTFYPIHDIAFESNYYYINLPQSIVLDRVNRGRLLGFIDKYNPSNYGRIAFWRAALLIYKDHPFIGVGDIDVADNFVKYKRPTDKEVRGHFHNNVFHIMATLGTFGLIAYLLLVVLAVIAFMRTLKLASGTAWHSYAIGLFGVFAGFLFSGLTEWNFGDHETVTWLWLTLGLQFALFAIMKKDKQVSSR